MLNQDPADPVSSSMSKDTVTREFLNRFEYWGNVSQYKFVPAARPVKRCSVIRTQVSSGHSYGSSIDVFLHAHNKPGNQ